MLLSMEITPKLLRSIYIWSVKITGSKYNFKINYTYFSDENVDVLNIWTVLYIHIYMEIFFAYA